MFSCTPCLHTALGVARRGDGGFPGWGASWTIGLWKRGGEMQRVYGAKTGNWHVICCHVWASSEILNHGSTLELLGDSLHPDSQAPSQPHSIKIAKGWGRCTCSARKLCGDSNVLLVLSPSRMSVRRPEFLLPTISPKVPNDWFIRLRKHGTNTGKTCSESSKRVPSLPGSLWFYLLPELNPKLLAL